MAWTFQSVAVVGSGAIGLYYGGRLAAAGNDVRFLLRSDYEDLMNNGLTVESIDGDFHVADLQGFRSPEEIGPVDLVIVAWKTTANDQFGAVLPALLHDNTQVLTLQNGLGNCETIARHVPPGNILGGLCFVCCNRIGHGVVRHSAGGKIAIGEFGDGLPSRATAIAKRFGRAGIPAEAVENLERAQWEKLVWNIPFNGLSVAEGGKTTDVLLSDPATNREIRGLMHEVITAARAQGLPLEESLVEININRTGPMDAYRTSSMIDFVEGREVEVGPIWEEPLRRAKAAGAETPRLARLVERIHARIAERG